MIDKIIEQVVICECKKVVSDILGKVKCSNVIQNKGKNTHFT